MTLPTDWVDPGHDLPEPGTYRDLDAWVDSKGRVYVGNRDTEVVSVAHFREEHRMGDDGAGSSPPSPADRPPSRWVRLVGPWRKL